MLVAKARARRVGAMRGEEQSSVLKWPDKAFHILSPSLPYCKKLEEYQKIMLST